MTLLEQSEPPSRRHLPSEWRWESLSQICVINPRRPEIVRDDDAPTTFISMSAVDEGGRGGFRPELRPFADVRKGYTYFGEGDVLFAKITPCMQNGKQAIARNLVDGFGFGSTEFHVLRPGPGVISEWLQRFVAQPWILHDAVAHFTGSVGQQRVPEAFLASLRIPVPPLLEQQRIVSLLTQKMTAVDAARAAAEAQLSAIKQLPASYLRAAFSGAADDNFTENEDGIKSRTS